MAKAEKGQGNAIKMSVIGKIFSPLTTTMDGLYRLFFCFVKTIGLL